MAPSPIAPAGTNHSSLNTQSTPQRGPSNGASAREASLEPSNNDGQDATFTSIDHRASTSTAAATTALTPSTLQQGLLGQRTPQARLYTPRIYGFRVSEHSKSGPRMRWMRMRPESFEELDQGIASTAATTSTTKSATGKGHTSSTDSAMEGHEATTSQKHATHSVTPDGRSTATGRPMAGRAPSLTNAAAGTAM